MRFLSVMLAVTICVFFLAGCDNVKGNKMCEHNWKRAENLNEYTAVDNRYRNCNYFIDYFCY